nr:uncharacterized protein LOC122592449 isoform X2 [Erigeron canadensis]
MPPILQQLIGTSHIFETKSHTYYQVADYESFNCSKVVVTELSDPEFKKEDMKSISFGNESRGSSLAISNVTENPLEISHIAEAGAVVMNDDKGVGDNVATDVVRGKKRQFQETNVVGDGKKAVK